MIAPELKGRTRGLMEETMAGVSTGGSLGGRNSTWPGCVQMPATISTHLSLEPESPWGMDPLWAGSNTAAAGHMCSWSFNYMMLVLYTNVTEVSPGQKIPPSCTQPSMHTVHCAHIPPLIQKLCPSHEFSFPASPYPHCVSVWLL